MKRSKVSRVAAPTAAPYQRSLPVHGVIENDEYSNEMLGVRMFENMKMALFFSWIQGQMNKDKRDQKP
ncbi:hypothetical protein [Parapedobacter koreensis]|uniref:Uncharacterized protein n=1 Tax=Parapedobacter koreensis TaxID=332977 RepID=A0A1H7NYG4_9SPHI|nr:hypothetical protein [Parapedobacter koreensis]SEL28065.1 hypothetical protein SAMN05421740_104132 [Parapedobacter koreensis]